MWSSRHWVPEIWTWLYSLKSQKAKYVSPHFHIIMENLYFFQTAQARYVTSLLEPVIESHGWFWWIFLLFRYQWYYCCFLKLLVMKIYLKVWWKLYFQENPFHFIIVVFSVRDEDFEGWWKLHFQENSFPLPLWLFMKWALRWERCNFWEKNKQESLLFIYLRRESKFLGPTLFFAATSISKQIANNSMQLTWWGSLQLYPAQCYNMEHNWMKYERSIFLYSHVEALIYS